MIKNLRYLCTFLLLWVAGVGLAQDVVEISTVDQLKAFRDAVNSGTSYAGKTVKLTADLDLQGEDWIPIGTKTMGSYPGISFKGDFDGCNHTISNLKVNSSEPEWATAGLFGSIASGTIQTGTTTTTIPSSIKNLTLKNVDITSTHWAGGIVAYASDDAKGSSIENCKVIGGTIKSTPEIVNGSYDNGNQAGGIMGYNASNFTINNCWVENVTITAYRDLGGIVGCSNGTVTKNTAKNVTVTQDLTNGYKNPTPTTIGDIVGRGTATNNVEANGNIVIKSDPVAQIGETKYETIADAVAAANAGDVIEVIKAGDYKLPNLPKNVTIEGKADGEVSFTYTTANSSIASVPNGATFKNVTFNWGDVNYHGFQEAGTINMENCKHNGRFFSYGNMNFTKCEFEYSGDEYCMWVYGAGEVVYDQCTFTNNTKGKLLHLYCEGTSLEHNVTVKDCKFVNGGSLSKAAVNVKATSANGALQYELHLEGNNTYEGNFPTTVGEQANADKTWILSPLAQVDDRAVNPDKITVYENDVLIYPNYVAAIGDTKYTTLQLAFDAANSGDVVKLLKDYDAKNEAMAGGTRQFVINKSITFDGGGNTLTTKQRGIGVGNVNGDVAANIDVTIKNVTVLNTSDGARCIDTRGMIGSLTLDGVTLSTDGAPSGYTQPLTIGGNQTDAATVTITNSTIQTNEDGTAYYAITTFNPVNMTISNSTLKGWACIYAKGADGSAGSAGSVFNLDKCTLVSTNEYSGTSNAFGAFVIEDNNVTINVTNSDIQINSTGDQWQTIVSDQGNTYTEGGVNLGEGNAITLSGKSAFAYEGNSLIVSGGVSNVPVPEAFCAEGMIPTANTDSETMEKYPYTVKVGQFVAQIEGGAKYETLQAAVDAAEEDATIDILKDFTLTTVTTSPSARYNVNIDKSVTINGNNHVITGSEGKRSIILMGEGNNITLKDLTLKNNKSEACLWIGDAVNASLDNVTLDGTNGIAYNQPLTISQFESENRVTLNITNGSVIKTNDAGTAHYSIIAWHPADITVTNSKLIGWAGVYLKPDAAGSTVKIDGSEMKSTGIKGNSNNFAAIVTESGNNEIEVKDTKISTTPAENTYQSLFVLGGEGNVVKFLGSSTYETTDMTYGPVTHEPGSLVNNKVYFDDATKAAFAKYFTAADGPIISDEKESPVDLYPLVYTPEVYYYWIADGKEKGGYYHFAEPFTNGWLADGEFIQLMKDVTLTENIACQLESGASFTLTLGDYKVTRGNFSVSLKPGVTVHTDKSTSIFSAAEEGYVVKSTKTDNGYTYTVGEADLMFTDANGKVSYKAFSPSVITANGTYKLLKDITATARIAPGILASNIIVDLNGHTLTSTATDYGFLLSRAGTEAKPKTFELVDNSEEKGGKLVVNTEASAAIQAQGKYNEVVIGEGVTVENGCVAILSENDKLTVEGTIIGGDDFAVATNGSTTKNVNITIKEGAVLTSNETAMYLPGNEGLVTTVEGGSITGAKTGIEVRAGKLTVNGGTISTTAEEYSYTPNGNGTTTKGAAIAVVQHTTVLPIDVQVLGGNLTGLNTIAVVDAQNNNLEGVAVKAKDELVAANTEIPAGYKWASNNDGTSTLAPCTYVAKIGDTQYESLAAAVEAVPAGTETTIVMIADEAIDVVGYAVTIAANQNVVLDLAGHTVAGQCLTGKTSALIRNLGTLRIEDSTDTNKDGSGNGKLTMSAEPFWVYSEADPGGYASNLIRNEKNLTVESGLLYNNGTGSACYAIDNYSAGNVTINGGKVDAAKASAIRMFYVNGGSITVNEGVVGHYNNDDDCTYMGIQVMSGTNANVTINGGTIAGNYAFYANNTGGKISISDGTFDGYVGIAAVVPNDILSITGGAFNEWVGTWGSQTKFISGGIFAANDIVDETLLADGYILADNTDPETMEAYPYAVRQANYICAIGETKYETLQDAINACEAGTETTIKLLDNVTDGAGFAIPDGVTNKNIIIDFDGKSYNVTKGAVGSTGTTTQAMHFYSGNTLTLKNGTITSAATSDENKLKMMMQNYCDLTLDGMTIVCSNVNGGTYENIYTGADAYWNNKSVPVFNFNTGNATIKNTTITFRDGDNVGLCVDGGTVVLGEGVVVNGPVSAVTGTLTITDGKYSGAVTADQATVQISGGIFTEKPADEYCVQGYVVTDNTDEATKDQYPFTVQTKEAAGIYELIHDVPYKYVDGVVNAEKVTYTRTFEERVVGKFQTWYVPFDYTISEKDLENFKFYKIHLISAANQIGGEVTNNTAIYVYVQEVGANTKLTGNRPYVLKAKNALTDFVFEVNNTKLYAKDNSSRLHVETTDFNYDFYGNYEDYSGAPQYTWYTLNKDGQLQGNSSTATLRSYRWYIKATARGENDDYAKPNIFIVEGDGDTDGISNAQAVDGEIEGIYTLGGMKVEHPVKGVNIIKYTDGRTKKINVK